MNLLPVAAKIEISAHWIRLRGEGEKNRPRLQWSEKLRSSSSSTKMQLFQLFDQGEEREKKCERKEKKAAEQICDEKKLTGGRLHEKGRSANKPAF